MIICAQKSCSPREKGRRIRSNSQSESHSNTCGCWPKVHSYKPVKPAMSLNVKIVVRTDHLNNALSRKHAHIPRPIKRRKLLIDFGKSVFDSHAHSSAAHSVSTSATGYASHKRPIRICTISHKVKILWQRAHPKVDPVHLQEPREDIGLRQKAAVVITAEGASCKIHKEATRSHNPLKLESMRHCVAAVKLKLRVSVPDDRNRIEIGIGNQRHVRRAGSAHQRAVDEPLHSIIIGRQPTGPDL